ncbi:MAG: flagellar filament capping protein FliD [Phycisphaerales bacterium]|nr:flagellar filament capping protein FliD [Phycisphaerales bacterium]
MGRISTGVGLVSGINSKDIIDQLMALESRPKDLLQSRIDAAGKQKTAYTTLQTKFASIKLNAQALQKPSTFNNANTTSSDENVLTATAAAGAAIGSFQFQVARLVSSQQIISNGMADYDKTAVGAGTITIEMGGGELRNVQPLAQLRGGEGIRRGNFRITDRSGNSAVIDITSAVTLDDVVKKINTALDLNIKASVGREGLVVQDLSGGTGNFTIEDLSGGHAAADLGIAASVGSSTITGADLNYLGINTALSQLNDSRGVRTASSGADFTLVAADGTSKDITLAGVKTIGGVLDAINTNLAGKIRASVNPGDNQITLTDISGGGGSMSLTPVGGSMAATDLGLLSAPSGNVITGTEILSSLNSVSLSALKGGSGLTLGSIKLTNRLGASATVNLSAAKTVQDVLDALSGSGLGISASLNGSQNGISITDNSGGTGNLVIEDTDPTNSATALGLAGTFDRSKSTVNGANLQRQWVSGSTQLGSYNGGKGVTPGKFRITNSAGTAREIDLSNAATMNMNDVIAAINASNAGVTASINANGDGLLLTDTAGGAGTMKVEDVNGTSASDLQIKGTAVAGVINGTMERTLSIAATDTLADVQQKITTLSFGLTANIINDGSGAAPYRLSLTSFNAGYNGRVVFDTGNTSLSTRTLVEAQDAAVFVGGSDTDNPLLITAGRNQLAGVVPGVTIDLHGTSTRPITLNVTRNADKAVEQIKAFTDGFNEVVDSIADLTKFDLDTKTSGLLLGDAAIQQVQTQMYAAISGVVSGVGRYRMLADVGIKIGEGAKVEFDEDKFRSAYGTDPEAVKNLFAAVQTTVSGQTITQGLAYSMSDKITRLIDPVNGIIIQENKTLDNRTDQFQDRIDSLDKLLVAKRTRLERQFANMESVLAGLQSQQQALSQMQFISPMSSSTKK